MRARGRILLKRLEAGKGPPKIAGSLPKPIDAPIRAGVKPRAEAMRALRYG